MGLLGIIDYSTWKFHLFLNYLIFKYIINQTMNALNYLHLCYVDEDQNNFFTCYIKHDCDTFE
jgi:hypothetical protein